MIDRSLKIGVVVKGLDVLQMPGMVCFFNIYFEHVFNEMRMASTFASVSLKLVFLFFCCAIVEKYR